jgi:hypothetical protein
MSQDIGMSTIGWLFCERIPTQFAAVPLQVFLPFDFLVFAIRFLVHRGSSEVLRVVVGKRSPARAALQCDYFPGASRPEQRQLVSSEGHRSLEPS